MCIHHLSELNTSPHSMMHVWYTHISSHYPHIEIELSTPIASCTVFEVRITPLLNMALHEVRTYIYTHTHTHIHTHAHTQPLPDQQKASPFPPPPEDPFPTAPVELEMSERKEFNFSDGVTAAELKAKQFPRSDLLLLEKLGEGEYGPIYRCASVSLQLDCGAC